MEDFLIVLVVLLYVMIVLAVVAAAGHGLWVVAAWLLRQLMGRAAPAKHGRRPTPSWAGAESNELAELDVVSQHLQKFRDQGVLDLTSWRRLHDHIEERRKALQQPASPAWEPAAEAVEVATAKELVAASPVQELEALLDGCQDVRNLTLGNRLRAVAQYRKLSEDERIALNPMTHWNVARLLGRLGFAEEAMRTYRQLLLRHPEAITCGEMALEAGRTAAPRDAVEGRWFLERALAEPLPPEQRREAEALLRGLPGGAVEEVLEVVPVAEEERPAVLRFRRDEAPVVALAPPPKPPIVVPAEPPPRPPRRSFTELLSAFMEERNILWGEIVGGLLMVGCSIALVMYLGKTYKEFPYFPFFIFTGVTASIFGAGLYALHRLKLDFTGRSLLVIGALLVPLNFLVLAHLSQGNPRNLLQIASEVLTLAAFSGLVWLTGRTLVPDGIGWLTAAVVGTSASQLLSARAIDHQAAGWLFLLLGLVPVACQGAGTAALIRAGARKTPFDRRPALAFLEYLGLATFAVAVALGFMAYLGGDLGPALQSEALLIALAGVPILAGGLFVQRGLADEKPLAGLRTAATAVALIGMLVMLAGLALAWPRPGPVIGVALLNFAVLTAFAFRGRLPIAHAAALPCLAVAYWTALRWLRGHLDEPVDAGFLSRTAAVEGGVGLVFLTAALTATAEGLVRLGQRTHAPWYLAGSGAVALASLALVMSPFDAPAAAALVCGLYGFGTLVANLRWRQPLLTYGGLGLILGMTLWALQWLSPPFGPLWPAVVAGAALLLVCLATLARGTDEAFRQPLRLAGEMVAYLALLGAVLSGIQDGWAGAHAITGVCLFGVFLMLTVVENQPYMGRMAAWLALGTAVALAGWINSLQPALLHPEFHLLLTLAAASTGLALVAVVAGARSAGWLETLAATWLETAGITLRMVPAIGALLAVLSRDLPVGLACLTCTCLAATAFLSAWGYRRVLLTWAGSGLVVLAGAAGLSYLLPGQSLLYLGATALLIHATAMLAVSLALQSRIGERLAADVRDQVLRLYAGPLLGTALVASALALPLLVVGPGPLERQALSLGWLAVLWLVLAWVERWPALFSAFQAVLSGAVLYGIAALLNGQEWVRGPLDLLAHTWSWQAYGLGLAGLGLLWTGVRHGSRAYHEWDPFLEPPWPRVDRVLLGLVIVGQVMLAVLGLIPGLSAELARLSIEPAAAGWLGAMHTGYAWWLLGASTLALAAGLWHRRQTGAVLGLLLLALTVPMLTAGRFAGEHAVAPALAWGLAIVFLLGSAGIWLRDRLIPAMAASAIQARWLLVGGALVPLLAVTAALGAWSFVDEAVVRPDAVSFFSRIGWLTTLVVPLFLATVGLTGHALRDRLSGYAAVACLVANATLMGAFALATWAVDMDVGVRRVRILQLGASGFALWGLAWLPIRRGAKIGEWTGQPCGQALSAVPLLFGLLCLAAALAPAAAWFLVFSHVADLAPAAREAGAVLGWSALALFAAFYLERVWRKSVDVLPAITGGFGLVALLLLAADSQGLGNSWGQRALMLSWAGYALAWPVGLAILARRQRKTLAELPPHWHNAAALWTAAAGLLAVGLGLKNAYFTAEQPWSAAAFAVAGAAGALTAVQRRQESWAFVAGFGFNLAASVLVWHFQGAEVLWVHLLQANVIATAVAALLWLAVRGRIYESLEISLRGTPLLAIQVGLALVGNALLLAWPLTVLVAQAGETLPTVLAPFGSVWGLTALALALAAYLGYAAWTLRESRAHGLIAFGLALGVWAACAIAGRGGDGWHAYYVLLSAWTLTGLTTLAVGWFGASFEAASWPRLFSAAAVRDWVNAIGLLLIGLALRAWPEPARPFWSAAGVLAAAGLATGLALWLRSAAHVVAAGLLVDLALVLVWLDRGSHTPGGFVAVNALGLALTATFWSAIELALRAGQMLGLQRGRAWAYRHVAAAVGLAGLLGLAGFGIVVNLAIGEALPVDGLTWIAWAAVSLALAIGLWDVDARWTLAGLYAAGLTAIGLGLLANHSTAANLGWTGALLLAGYVLAAGALRQFHAQMNGVWQGLRWPVRLGGWPHLWFSPVQTALGGLVVALSVWIALTFLSGSAGLAGPLAVALVLPASIWLATSDQRRYATLALGVVVLAEIGWALLDPNHAVWLHRTVLLMTALAGLTLAYGVGLARLLPRDGDWARCCRASGPVLGLAATAVLLLIIVQELLLYDAVTKRTQMAVLAAIVVAAALVVLIGAGISFAVMPGRDPFGLSERGRMLYVYAAEVLLLLLFVHVRLNAPHWFGGLGKRHWPFIVMGIAFLGVGLSEFFHRRGWRVLAEPLQRTGLFLPLLPLLQFWTQLSPETIQEVSAQAPGLQPLLGYFQAAEKNFARYAGLWFLVGAMYTFLAFARKSHRWALLAALAANCGWWALLYEHSESGIGFLSHPQLWLIPLALIVLVAEFINRDQLAPGQAATLRYLGLLGIYLSSTADMFLAGLGNSLVLPVVLTLLALSGVLGGILLRVRAFLFLGVAFLGLVIVSMIWHAAMDRHHYWIWWITGIVLGGAIIALFALFEKRRNEVLHLVDQLRHWD